MSGLVGARSRVGGEHGTRDRSVAFLGLFGGGNFGNDASLDAAAATLQRRRPDCRVVVVCEETAGAARRWPYRILSLHHAGRAERWVPRGRLGRAALRLPIEVARAISTFSFLRSIDAVVVPGTGILDDFGTRPREMPYDLFRWSVLARLARRPFHFVAVGAGPVTHPASKWLFRGAARAATSCSFRDEGSRAFMGSIGRDTSRDQLVPDLVWGLDDPLVGASAPASPGRVVLGVMSYYGWTDDPTEGQRIHDEYRTKLIRLAHALVAGGRTVTVVLGQNSDEEMAAAVDAGVREVMGIDAQDRRIEVSGAARVEEVMAEMQGAETVIATRFHNVVAALAVHVPVVSLGYAAKNDAVLDEMGLGEFAHRVEDFDVDTVLADLEAVTSRRDELVTGIAAGQARLTADCCRYLDDVVDGLAGRAGHGAARG